MNARRMVLALALLVATTSGVVVWRAGDDRLVAQRVGSERAGEASARVVPRVPRHGTEGGQASVEPTSDARDVRGIVVDTRGRPVDGAEVRVLSCPPPWKGETYDRLVRSLVADPPVVDGATTGPDGRFRLAATGEGTYDVVLRHVRHGSRVERGILLTPSREWRWVLAPGDSVEGRVVRLQDTGREPAAGVTIIAFPQGVFPRDPAASVSAISDADGMFRLDGMTGRAYVVDAISRAGDGSVAVQRPIDLSEIDALEIVLHDEASLSGRVRGPAGNPVEGAEVTAFGAAEEAATGIATTGPDGRYVISGLSSGPLSHVRVQADGLAPYAVDWTDWEADPPPVMLAPGENTYDVQLDAGALVRGCVFASGTRTPIAGAEVSIFGPGSFRHSVVSASDGSFEIRGVPPGVGTLTARHELWCDPMFDEAEIERGSWSWAESSASASTDDRIAIRESGQLVRKDVHLEPRPVLRGRVVGPDDEALAWVQVSMLVHRDVLHSTSVHREAFAVSAPDGSFEIPLPGPRGVSWSTRRVEARAAGWVTSVTELDPGDDDASEVRVIRLTRGAVVEGTVATEDGEPISDACVTWAPYGDAIAVATDAVGRYRIEGVPAGQGTVLIRHPDFLPRDVDDVVAEEGRTIEVSTLLERGESIHGTVVDAAGRPSANATVWGELQDGTQDVPIYFGPRYSDVVVTDRTGAFVARGLPPGRFELSAFAPGAAPAEPVVVATGERAVTLRLGPLFSITGRVRLRGGAPVRNALVTILRWDQDERDEVRTRADGTFVLPDVDEGTHQLRIQRGAWYEPNIVSEVVDDVEAGGPPLEITVEPGATIEGRVLVSGGIQRARGRVSCWPAVESDDPSQEDTSSESTPIEADGSFRLVGLRPGRYRVEVDAPPAQPAAVTADTGTTDLVVPLAPGATLRGALVWPEGKWARAFVEARTGPDLAARTAVQHGVEFELTSLATGRYELIAYDSDSREPISAPLVVDADAGKTLEGLVIRVRASTDR